MIEKIRQYTESVNNGTLKCTIEACPRCHSTDGSFICHEKRDRFFLAVVFQIVYKAMSKLIRWKCTLCSATFTLYPDFAIRHKRYVKDVITEKSTRYVEDESQSYRDVVMENGHTMGYSDLSWGVIDDRTLAPSTVHRWITSFGCLCVTLRSALELIKQKETSSGIFRTIIPIHPRKYRSNARRKILQRCRQLLQSSREYRVIFGVSIFPDFATACAWK